MNDYLIALPARLHRDELRREAARHQRAAHVRRRPGRERLADALVVLAARLAPASQAAPARQVAECRRGRRPAVRRRLLEQLADRRVRARAR